VIKSRTQVIVVVEADPGVRSQSSVVHVEVRGQANGTERGELVFDRRLDVGAREDVEFPLRVVMGPLAGDAERGWDLTATAQSGERPNLTDLVRVRATGTYVEGRTVTLTLRLEDCCTTIACSEQQTCRLCSCVDPYVDVTRVVEDAGLGLDADSGAMGDDAAVRDASSGGCDEPSLEPQCVVSFTADDIRALLSSGNGIGPGEKRVPLEVTTGPSVIEDMDVRISIGSSRGDTISVRLAPPGVESGGVLLVPNRTGNSCAAPGGLQSLTFDDEAEQRLPSCRVSSGSYRPEGELCLFDRGSANGVWTLQVAVEACPPTMPDASMCEHGGSLEAVDLIFRGPGCEAGS